MKNGGKIFFLITAGLLIALIVLSVVCYIQMCDLANLKIWELILENQLSKGKLEECQRYNLFQQAVSKIGKKPYSEDYDCYEHAKDLQKELRDLDIESSILINEGRDHALNCAWIESITGQFISPENDYKIIEIR